MQTLILLPIGIVNSNQDQKEVITRFNPLEVDYYYPGFYNGTVVVLKSGNSFLTTLSAEQFDSLLINFDKVEKSNKGRFGILKIEIK